MTGHARKTTKTAPRRSQLHRGDTVQPNPAGNRAERRAAKKAAKRRGENDS